MFDVCAETLDLPLEEKMKYEQGDNGDSFGFVRLHSTDVLSNTCLRTDTKLVEPS